MWSTVPDVFFKFLFIELLAVLNLEWYYANRAMNLIKNLHNLGHVRKTPKHPHIELHENINFWDTLDDNIQKSDREEYNREINKFSKSKTRQHLHDHKTDHFHLYK